jgi:hypothetical protein
LNITFISHSATQVHAYKLQHLAEADQSDNRIDDLDSPVLGPEAHRVAKKLLPSHNPAVDSTRLLRAFVLQNVALHFSDDKPSHRGQLKKQGGIA